MDSSESNRRPLRSRSSAWARRAAAGLAASAVTPNQISVASVAFAAIGAAGLLWLPAPWSLLLCALCIQLRLLCNLLDGMVAVEGGKKSAVGGLYNEVPDRVADSLFIVAAGYLAGVPSLGWCGALLAALTAYIRTLGGALGLIQDFRGPMAKQHRMAVLTLACLLGAAESLLLHSHYALLAALWLIAIGSLLTCVARLRVIAETLRIQSGGQPAVMRPSSGLLVGLMRLLVGAYPRWLGCDPGPAQRIYFANHTSHIDTLAIWSALPPQLRATTRPVAAKDYWDKGLLRRYIASKGLHVVLIERAKEGRQGDPLQPLADALEQGESLIIFPEGTRGTAALPAAFKSGLYHLAQRFPAVELVPVYLENLHRSMPKGTIMPVPLICTVRFGTPVARIAGESKEAFLVRARDAVVVLA